jgi:hypothetical protein
MHNKTLIDKYHNKIEELEKKFIIYLIVFAKSILFLDATRYDR